MAPLSNVSLTWDEQDRPVISVQYAGGDDVRLGSGDPDSWLVALADRLTDKSAAYLRGLMQMNGQQGAVSLNDLAAQLGATKGEVDGWNRNLGRSIKAIVRDYGFLRPEQEDGTAQLFDYEWDKNNNLWKYVVPERFRRTLSDALADAQ